MCYKFFIFSRYLLHLLLALLILSVVSCNKAKNNTDDEEDIEHLKVSMSINFHIDGLPSNATNQIDLNFSQSKKSSVSVDAKNGSFLKEYNLVPGDYAVIPHVLYVDKVKYSARIQTINIKQGETNDVKISFRPSTLSKKVKGWPEYIAMGAVLHNANDPAGYKDRPIDSIFRYGGEGGNGDRGRLTFPVQAIKMSRLVETLSQQFPDKHKNKKVVPTIVLYTAEMSGGVSYEDINERDNLIKHFINLAMEAYAFQVFRSDKNPYPGSIVLNPDLMGMVQQIKLWDGQDKRSLNKMNLPINETIQNAYWFLTQKQKWSGCPRWKHKDGEPIAPNLDFGTVNAIDLMGNMLKGQYIDELKQKITVNDMLYPYAFCGTRIFDSTMKKKYYSALVPRFEDNFRGWVQANNWIIKEFAPDVTFGWQVNIWATGTANFVHLGLSEEEINVKHAKPVADLWNAVGLYNGEYRPDFIVFDKYEQDAMRQGTYNGGYLWNQKDLNAYMTFVKLVAEQIGGYPVMLWQIPGGHIQLDQASGEKDLRPMYGSTEPDYFFGNPKIKADFSNVAKYFLEVNGVPRKLEKDKYMDKNGKFPTSVIDHLTSGGQDWTKPHLDKLLPANVFAILWGGGFTTSIGRFDGFLDQYDQDYLRDRVLEYYEHPIFIGE